MSNVRATLRSIFGILFILSITFTAYGQQEQQPAALSQSQFEKILEKIGQLPKSKDLGLCRSVCQASTPQVKQFSTVIYRRICAW